MIETVRKYGMMVVLWGLYWGGELPVDACHCPTARPSIPDHLICTIAEKMPHFKGDNHEFLNYLYQNLDYYPDTIDPYRSNFPLSFVIDEQGRLIRARILPDDGRLYTKMEGHLVALLEASPLWEPAYCKGKAVAIRYQTILRLNLRP